MITESLTLIRLGFPKLKIRRLKMWEIYYELLQKKGVKNIDVSRATGIPPSTFSDWKKGKSKPKADKLQKIADYFGVSSDYLITGKTSSKYSLVSKKPSSVWIPVLGRVAAGIPIDIITDIIDQEQITEEMAATGEYFALQIHGDSMEPRMKDGDVVIVRQQDDAKTGDIVISAINGDDATCKRLKKYAEGIILLSSNSAYEPMVFTNKDISELPVKILGKVVELRAKF